MYRFVFVVAICLLLYRGAVHSESLSDQPPPLPATFYGTVVIDGVVAPDGTLIEARINGMLVGSRQVMTAQGESGRYSLQIPGESGQIVVFSAGAILLSPTGIWETGTPIELNLAGATPTETSTSTATPS